MSPRKGVCASSLSLLSRTCPPSRTVAPASIRHLWMSSPFESVFRGIGNAPPAVPCCIVLSASFSSGTIPSKNVAPPVYPFCARSYSVLKGGIARVWICTGSGAHQSSDLDPARLPDSTRKSVWLVSIPVSAWGGQSHGPYAKPFVLIRRGLTHHMALISGICLQASHPWGDGTYSLSGVDAPLGSLRRMAPRAR